MPKFKLMKHQVEGVNFLHSVDGIGALLWDPGVGKTGATLAWIDSLAQDLGEVRVLVVSPLAATDTWVLQPPMFMDSAVKARMLEGSTVDILGKIRKSVDWTKVPAAKIQANHPGTTKRALSGCKVTILSMSAGAVSSFCTERPRTVQMLRAVREYKPHVIVVDESHIIKSPTANISTAMYQMGQLAPHRIILTGTVNPLSILDCFGQWRFLAPWTFSPQHGEPFTKRPLRMTRMQQQSIRPWPWGTFKTFYTTPGGHKGKGIGGFQHEADLYAKVAERSHVVRKEDALDLPPVSNVDVHVTLSAKEQRAYDEMRRELAMELDSGELLEAPNALAKMMKLRQIHAGFVRDTETEETHVLGDSLRRTVAEIVNVNLAAEQRVVVFGYFKTECEQLAAALKLKGRTVELINGSTKAKDRLTIRQGFLDVSGNPQQTVLVAQIRTMSLSVNELVSASHAVFASPSERRVDWVQSHDRLDRKGQTKPVTFWHCFAPGLVADVMIQNHAQRGNLEKVMLDHIRATPR